MKDLIVFRRELHKYPELSQNESATQKRILGFLESIGIEGKQIGLTGVYVLFDSGNEGKTIMLRSDHDALPIQEINSFDHKSVYDGVSHKCGHDGHTAIMCGVAKHFHQNPLQKGKLLLVFQPAEEIGEGAKAILSDERFTFEPDLVFALHNLPGYPLHEIVFRKGNFTASVKSMIIKLDGKTSHAAEPELGISPALAISELIHMFKDVSQPDLTKDYFALTTPVFIQMGEESYGVSASHGEIHYTLRTWSTEVMEKLIQKLEEGINEITKNNNLEVSISWTDEFDSNKNDADAVRLIENAIDHNQYASTQREWPFKWGEDFGLFTQKYSGAMFGIGSGENCPALHNPDYDFPDEIIKTGINMFTSIVEKAINE